MLELTKPSFSSYVSFDIETTGLGAGAQIVEIGAAKVTSGKVTETFSKLVNPTIKMDPRASAVNGITDSMLVAQPPISAVIRDFVSFIGGSILVGHNIKNFDLFYIQSAADREGLSLQNSYFDTMLFARRMRHKFGWTKIGLEYLMHTLSLPRNDAHRALGDSLDVAAFYSKICDPGLQNHISNASKSSGAHSAPGKAWSAWERHIHSQTEQLKRQIRAAQNDTKPVSVDKAASSAKFIGSSSIYTASLTECSCTDYRTRKLPCKHMYRLASELRMHTLRLDISYSEIDNAVLKDEMPAEIRLADPNLEKHLAQCIKFSNEPVLVSKFINQINEALSEKGKIKLQARAITDLLLKNGYLELDEYNQQIASTKGISSGITSMEQQKQTGEKYMQNLYSESGQKLLFKYAIIALHEKLC